ncbi:LexA family protein [Pectobacterium brasiliense]|uniref:LexA family protein n=1 Tax=Pectobacterium brasiliense TaxID=180957 RepID=UPI00057DD181|nr:S24 family peptidase [Pectobacterium brasiliense]KHS87099.1 repressor [Pectobacterium brasiliense]
MESKEIRRANLAYLLDEHIGNGATKASFAEKAGISAQLLSQRIGDNAFRNIGDAMARKIEDSLGLPNGWMDVLHAKSVSSDTNVEYLRDNEPTGEYPVISWVMAGAWSEAIEPYPRAAIDRWYETTVECSDSSFWLIVKGDSMTSQSGLSIPEGTAILVDPDVEPINGKLVVAKLESENEATFKRLILDAGRKFLKPLNPQYPLTEINGNCRIIGVVVDARITNLP